MTDISLQKLVTARNHIQGIEDEIYLSLLYLKTFKIPGIDTSYVIDNIASCRSILNGTKYRLDAEIDKLISRQDEEDQDD